MENPRFYGKAPWRAAVVHGGPGAPGSVAEVARELATTCGVIEPLQTVATVEGQVEELAALLQPHAPLTLIGHSWGAWLCVFTAALFPELASRLVLVCSGPFEAHYAKSIMPTRLSRMPEHNRTRALELLDILDSPNSGGDALAEFGALMANTDDYDPLPGEEEHEDEHIECSDDIFGGVWPRAAQMRASGELMSITAKLNCPVTAIHGDYDPHPWLGVKEPLERILHDFTFHLLPHCGHTPWREREAREAFFLLLRGLMD